MEGARAASAFGGVQPACLSERCRIRLGPAGASDECWCAAGRLECSCELQRAEREFAGPSNGVTTG
jgi:hypothetical protein